MEIRVTLDNEYVKNPAYAEIQLTEKDGTRKLAMKMENHSFNKLLEVVNNIDLQSPLVHTSIYHCVQALQGDIEKIQIYDAIGFFKAKMFIKDQRADNTYALHINVIDGIIIASVCRCPIFVLEEVFQKYLDHIRLQEEQKPFRILEAFDYTTATKM